MESSKTCGLASPGAACQRPGFAGARTAAAAALHVLIFISLCILPVGVENTHPPTIRKREEVSG